MVMFLSDAHHRRYRSTVLLTLIYPLHIRLKSQLEMHQVRLYNPSRRTKGGRFVDLVTLSRCRRVNLLTHFFFARWQVVSNKIYCLGCVEKNAMLARVLSKDERKGKRGSSVDAGAGPAAPVSGDLKDQASPKAGSVKCKSCGEVGEGGKNCRSCHRLLPVDKSVSNLNEPPPAQKGCCVVL